MPCLEYCFHNKIDENYEKNIIDLLGKKIDEPVLSAREKLILSQPVLNSPTLAGHEINRSYQIVI